MKLNIGPYELIIPEDAKISQIPHAGTTVYDIQWGIFHFFCHIDPNQNNPDYLGTFILGCTKQEVILEDVEINGIHGKRYGAYSKVRTWIDWYMKKGDSMICINLQGYGMPNEREKKQLEETINSLRIY